MASYVLFPPLVNSYEPAFVVGADSESEASLKVHFSLSSLSSISGNLSNYTVHAQIFRQDGVKVVNTQYSSDSDDIDCSTGTIINLPIIPVIGQDNYYYVEIKNSYLKSEDSLIDNSSDTANSKTYNGWIPGWVYKIQLRLSEVKYTTGKQESWMQLNSSKFSEWSTICYTKAISKMIVKIPLFNYNSSNPENNSNTEYTVDDVNFFGTIESSVFESNEDFKYVKISLYSKEDNSLIEESDEIYRLEQSNTYFEYRFKTDFQNRKHYYIVLDYVTENNYSPSKKLIFNFVIDNLPIETLDAFLVSVDTNYLGILTKGSVTTSIEEEEEEGRIALKLYSPSNNPWSGNICIRRASQDDEFNAWEDIQMITVISKNLNELGFIYDYTIESGKWYKYGFQVVSKYGEYGVLQPMSNPICRIFNNTFLLGQNNKQLKLQFDNVISSYKHQIYDSKTDTIGGQFPFIARNASVNYRTFAASATITFNMDENNTFLKNGKAELYNNYNSIAKLYDDDNYKKGRALYDYTYERDFRNEVLKFLQDGKPKLFKSPTEGNIIVRLTDINCAPKQPLDRMIYTVNFTANEIDENSLYNYLKYGFYNPGTYSTQLKNTLVYLGQLSGKFITKKNNFYTEKEKQEGDNIFKLIYKKYDSNGNDGDNANSGGYRLTLEDIQRLHITINGYYYKVMKITTDTVQDAETKETKTVTVSEEIPSLSYYKEGHQIRIPVKTQINGITENSLTLGNSIELHYDGTINTINIFDPRGQYEFDSLFKFIYKGSGDELYFLEGALEILSEEGNVKTVGIVDGVNATIDFLYTLSSEPYEKQPIAERIAIENIGQFYQEVAPGTNIYNIIALQHSLESSTLFQHFLRITSIEIEANPHTVFAIKDATDEVAENIEINDTGVLRLYELNSIKEIRYIGRRYYETPFDDGTVSKDIITDEKFNNKGDYIEYPTTDVSVTYRYVVTSGRYKSIS